MDRRKFLRAIGLEGVSLSLTGCRKTQDKTQDKYREVRLDELCKNKEKYIGSKIFVIGFIPCKKNGEDAEVSYKGTSRSYGPSRLAFNLEDRPTSKEWQNKIWERYDSGEITHKEYLNIMCAEPHINCYSYGHSCGEAYLALQDALEKAPHIAIDVKGTVGKNHLRVEELFIPISSVNAKIPFFYDKAWK